MLNIICLIYECYHLQLKIQQMYQSAEIKYYPLSVSKKESNHYFSLYCHFQMAYTKSDLMVSLTDDNTYLFFRF